MARAGNAHLRRLVTGHANVMFGIEYFLPGATPGLRVGCQGVLSASRMQSARVLPIVREFCALTALGYAVTAHEKPCMPLV